MIIMNSFDRRKASLYMYEVVKYRADLKEEWDRFIDNSKNSSFLLKRDYMEYHADRFEDASLMVYDGGTLILLLPANQKNESIVSSHAGLTYGGFVLGREVKLPVVLSAIAQVLDFYHQNGIDTLELKVIPRFFQSLASDEVDYAMFLCGGELYRRDTALVVDQTARIKYSGNYRREANRARKNGFTVQEEIDFKPFWEEVLRPNLNARFGVEPVHSLKEIETLQSRFPDSIKCYTTRNEDGGIECGSIFYLSANVAHSQYISSSDAGRRNGALNLLFIDLMDEVLSNYRFFDYGTANENQGKALNLGLLAWKERMGGRTVVHDFYRVDTSSGELIRSVSESK